MNFQEALKAMKDGKAVWRKSTQNSYRTKRLRVIDNMFISIEYLNEKIEKTSLTYEDINADDWEIVK